MGHRRSDETLQAHDAEPSNVLCAAPEVSSKTKPAGHQQRREGTHALLLDRASISRQNGYVEPDGTIRLYFTLEQAQTKLHRSRQSHADLPGAGVQWRLSEKQACKPALITLNYPADAKLIAKEGEDAQA